MLNGLIGKPGISFVSYRSSLSNILFSRLADWQLLQLCSLRFNSEAVSLGRSLQDKFRFINESDEVEIEDQISTQHYFILSFELFCSSNLDLNNSCYVKSKLKHVIPSLYSNALKIHPEIYQLCVLLYNLVFARRPWLILQLEPFTC